MKILVTGGSGFIGTNLIENLIKKGYEVRNIDINRPKITEEMISGKKSISSIMTLLKKQF